MFSDFTIAAIAAESTTIKSFYLKRKDKLPLVDFKPGQYVAVRVVLPGTEGPQIRNYTLSDSPGKDYYRITIKREEKGAVSGYFHDKLTIGDTVALSLPTGTFHLTPNNANPLILLSGGVGITPMLSMAEYLCNKQPQRKVHFVHSSSNGAVRPMAWRLDELIRGHKNFQASIFHTSPLPGEQRGIDYQFSGYISPAFLQTIITQKETDLFLCGPISFMESMYQYLLELGFNKDNIHYEFFGENKKLGHNVVTFDDPGNSFRVRFKKSNIETRWHASSGSLLELAETAGLQPAFNCRMGTCAACQSNLITGNYVYDPEPFMEIAENTLLICCAQPTSDIEIDI